MDTVDADPLYPRCLDQMAGASDWNRLHQQLTRPDPPHIIIVGPAGIGKSCATRLCLGSQIAYWLRCSQDPTLRDNRDRIKTAARRRVATGQISWIVLEHADALHADAQAFLRRIIETSMGSSRFVLEVRESAAIAEPLLSRCVLFQAPQLVHYEIRAEIMRRVPLLDIGHAEEFARTCDGNIRWAVLQGLGFCTEDKYETGFIGNVSRVKPTKWADVLRIMEDMYMSGTSPRAFSHQSDTVWDRPGGVCPWSLIGLELSQSVV